jgi:hypothetical protein
MIEQEDREGGSEYGPWPWIAGFALAAVIAAIMFTLATGRF